MRKHLITVLCLVAAIALYAVGFSIPATAFVVLGMLAEGTFWFRLLRRRQTG